MTLISSVETLQPPQSKVRLDSRVRPLQVTNPFRVAIVCDLVEEKWPSIDLVAEVLLEHLEREHHDSVTVTRICPPMRQYGLVAKKYFDYSLLAERVGTVIEAAITAGQERR